MCVMCIHSDVAMYRDCIFIVASVDGKSMFLLTLYAAMDHKTSSVPLAHVCGIFLYAVLIEYAIVWMLPSLGLIYTDVTNARKEINYIIAYFQSNAAIGRNFYYLSHIGDIRYMCIISYHLMENKF